MTAVDELASLEAMDVSGLSSVELASAVATAGRVRAWLDAFDVRVAARTAELAAAGSCGPVAEMLADGGRRRAKDAAAAASRAEACASMPAFESALASGAVSSGHVDAVARAAASLPESQRSSFTDLESSLVSAASSQTVEAFERDCRDLAALLSRDEGESRHDALRRQRRVTRWIDRRTGMHHTMLVLHPEADAKVAATLHAATRDRLLDPTADRDHVQADAMVDLITGARSVDRRVPEVSVLIDLQTLESGLHDRSVAETSAGVSLPPEAIRRFACDAEIIPVVLGGSGEVLDQGRAHRLATPAQRVALKAMHRTCVMPDCTVPVDDCRIHHTEFPWSPNGRTDLDVLVPICETDHHRVHEGGWILKIRPDRSITLTRPDGVVAYDGPTVDRTAGPPAARPPNA